MWYIILLSIPLSGVAPVGVVVTASPLTWVAAFAAAHAAVVLNLPHLERDLGPRADRRRQPALVEFPAHALVREGAGEGVRALEAPLPRHEAGHPAGGALLPHLAALVDVGRDGGIGAGDALAAPDPVLLHLRERENRSKNCFT